MVRRLTPEQQAKATRNGRLRAAGRPYDEPPDRLYIWSGPLLREYECGDCGRDLRVHEGSPLPEGYVLFVCHPQHCGFRRLLTQAEVTAREGDWSDAQPGGRGVPLGEIARAAAPVVID